MQSNTIIHILSVSKAEARRHRLPKVTPAALLLGFLQDKDCTANHILSKTGVAPEELLHHIEHYIADSCQRLSDEEIDKKQDLEYDQDVVRLLLLSDLEAKKSHAAETTDEHLLLAMLHDKKNEGKTLLANFGLTYTNAQSGATPSAPRAGLDALGNDGDFADPSGNTPIPAGGVPTGGAFTATTPPGNETPILNTYTIDLTAAAARGELDPVIGREAEIQRMAQILARRKKNNPIVIGLPGVGKTAVIEGLAQAIAARKVPHILQDKKIRALELSSLVAGTQFRGQFEERIRRLIAELKQHPDIIIYLDEIHTIIGAGSAQGSLDAAGMLKPALARGEIQCIGATTTAEYRNSIEKDGALNRRFQRILLEPSSREDTLQILHNLKERYEKHHNVTYTEAALEACVTLSDRYLTERALPDKAIDAMDEAGASAHILRAAYPPEIEEMQQKIAQYREAKLAAAARQDYEEAANMRDKMVALESQIKRLTDEWAQMTSTERTIVDGEDIAKVISAMSGVPVTAVNASETDRLRSMRAVLSERVVAQEAAIERVSRAIARARLGLKDPKRPIGTFLFVGPTGVGKTHLVQTLARHMFGSDDALIRIDMSEYGEGFSTSRLVGAPPGYVGYEKGGQLTEQVKRHPYSVVLFDEIEKAHKDVYNTLLSVMDEGRLTDSDGTVVDFRNVIMVMTSNCGSREISDGSMPLGFNTSNTFTAETSARIIHNALRKQFPPEFLNRLDDIVTFAPLSREALQTIARLQTSELVTRLATHGHQLTFSDEAIRLLSEKAYDPKYGARPLRRTIQQEVEDPVCDLLLTRDSDAALHIEVTADPQGGITICAS